MSPERLREVASRGGRSADPANRTFSKNREIASKAGKVGGKMSRGGGRPPKADA